jgi:O-antigen ligase
MDRLVAVFDNTTLQYRFKYAEAAVHLIKQRPVTGWGLWAFKNKSADAHAEIVAEQGEQWLYEQPYPIRVHNDWLEVFVDGGLVAATLVGTILWVVLSSGWEAMRGPRIILAAAWSTVVAVMACALFFFPLRVHSTLLMTAIMLGVIGRESNLLWYRYRYAK